MAMHHIMLKHLGHNGMKPELIAYLETLRNMWHVYCKCLYPCHQMTSNIEASSADYWHGFQSLEKIVLQHLQPESEIAAESGYINGYYMFCGEILDLEQTASGASSEHVYPESMTRVSQLEESARQGDMQAVVQLMHKHPELNCQDTWVHIVQCICKQVKQQPDSVQIQQPGSNHAAGEWTLWAEFLLAMCTLLAACGIHMSPLGFNLMVCTACSVGDMNSVLALTTYMHTHTHVQFHAGMLSSILSVNKVPYAAKCDLFLHMLQSSAHVGAHSEWSNVAVQVNSTLVSYMVQLAESLCDVQHLHQVVDVLGQEHCVELGAQDIEQLWSLAMDSAQIQEELKTWKNV
ncbi:hypothetical protein GGF45_005782 [Coemansia sp. RSA 551]|nr:hypothetical protein GGF45_005782 [Coemansia sp. RSA 551]